ncbi:MAG: hypothetical protein WBC44_02030 [Planctomycetaceae bacterium]
MPVKVKCSGCQTVLNAPDRVRGKAVKCPKCGTAIRVPAEATAKRKSAGVASHDDDEFLSSLDMNRLEDRSTRVCPKCGTIVGAEDVDCPMCGADLTTGGLGVVQRARVGRKGAAPSEYYGKALRDAGRYLVNKQHGLVWKSAFIFTFFQLLYVVCSLMIQWCHNRPPKAFWIFVGLVAFLATPGWIWFTQLELTKRALSPKLEKDLIRFEPFAAMALGIKSVAWQFFYGFPIWVLFGLPAAVLLAMGSSTGVILAIVAQAIFLPIALVSWPVAQANFAMPITWPGWMMHKVLQDVGRNIGPVLYWTLLAVLTAIPVAGVGVGAAFLAAKPTSELATTFAHNARINGAQEVVDYAEEEGEQASPEATALAGQEKKEIDWKLLLWPAGALLLSSIPLGYYVVFNGRTTAFFIKLFRPNMLNLIAHEKEYVYRPKTPEEKERVSQLTGPYTAYSVQMIFVVSAFIAAVGGVGLSFTGLGYGFGFWISCLIVNVVTGFLWWPVVVYKGFKESAGWGIGMLTPCIGQWVTLAFLGMFSERTKYEAQILGISFMFGMIAIIIQWTVLEGGEGAAEEAMISTVARFLC